MDFVAKIGYLGPPGTYTEEAAEQFAPRAERIPLPTVDTVFAAVQSGAVGCAAVPMENVIQGVVTETLDALFNFSNHIHILDMFVAPIEHALGVTDVVAPIAQIFSKDQALAQCSEYLRSHYPTARLRTAQSTAAAISQVAHAQVPGAAAIGKRTTLLRHGLQVVANNIGNIKHNRTRFALIAPRHCPALPPSRQDATSLAVYPHHDRVGLLQQILTLISQDYGLSCSSIHSRPDTRGAFRFYLEIEGHVSDAAVANCLQKLGESLADTACEIRLFGSYPRRPFNASRVHTIGIIGGTGKMGQWFARFLTDAGYNVLIAGRHTSLSWADCARQSQAILINVPIPNTEDTIRTIGPLLLPGQLLVDNTSIKSQPVKAMLASVVAGVEVLGMHTIFGPNIDNVQQQNVVFTRTPTSDGLASEFEAIFYKYGARITHCSPEYHDKQMALHQNIEHFSKIVLGELLLRHFPNIAELAAYASPNSRASLANLHRILAGDAELYAQIQMYNKEAPALIATYGDIVRELADALMGGQEVGLVERLNRLKSELQS